MPIKKKDFKTFRLQIKRFHDKSKKNKRGYNHLFTTKAMEKN